MTDAMWYYAQGDEEKGPVTTAQLKTLAANKQLQPTDLIWKDGMADWAPANTVRGLFDSASGSSPNIPAQANPPSGTEPSAGPSFTQSGEQPIGGTPPSPGRRPRVNLPTIDIASDPQKYVKFVGYALVVVGIMLVLTARGCDSLGNRNVARLQAKDALAKSKFDRKWEREQSEIRSQIAEIQNKDEPDPEDVERTAELQKQLAEVQSNRDKARDVEKRDNWAKTEGAAQDAQHNNAGWGYFREMGFVFGSMVFTFGLLCTGFTSTGPDRWISFVMLAIVTFSLYIWGFAWTMN